MVIGEAAGLFRLCRDANLYRAVSPVRLKSSFIYLANAVNDLRGNWSLLAVVLAPLALAAALCWLPDALNLQYRLATTFEPGSQNISYSPVDSIDPPSKVLPLPVPQPYSPWITQTLHLVFGVLTLLVTLITLSALKRIHAGIREPTFIHEVIEVYRSSIRLAPGFIWVTFLQLVAPGAGLFLFREATIFMPGSIGVWAYIALVLMIILGAILYALLFSRDLMRKRFFKVATRIGVFLAVWSGYNAWGAGALVVVSLLFGPVGVVSGFLGTSIFLADLVQICIDFAATAFLVAAGLRLYQDLREPREAERLDSIVQASMQPTAQLPRIAMSK
jgi:multisubunit Na+/H+ antiporter MnhC subunit